MAEDRRQAATLQASLSNYVATAALAVLVGAAGIFTYVSQTFAPSGLFYFLNAITALALVASIFVGGKGTGIVIEQIASRTWAADNKNGRYAAQAGLTLVGLFLLLVSTAIGVTAPRQESDLEHRVERIAREVDRLATRPAEPQHVSQELWLEHLIATADYRIDKLEAERRQAGDGNLNTVDAHLLVQMEVLNRQCEALAKLAREVKSSGGSQPVRHTCS